MSSLPKPILCLTFLEFLFLFSTTSGEKKWSLGRWAWVVWWGRLRRVCTENGTKWGSQIDLPVSILLVCFFWNLSFLPCPPSPTTNPLRVPLPNTSHYLCSTVSQHPSSVRSPSHHSCLYSKNKCLLIASNIFLRWWSFLHYSLYINSSLPSLPVLKKKKNLLTKSLLVLTLPCFPPGHLFSSFPSLSKQNSFTHHFWSRDAVPSSSSPG